MGMARQRGRPREHPENLVYLRLAVTPEENHQMHVAAALAGVSMAKFARTSVVDAARRTVAAGGLDPDRLPERGAGAEREGREREARPGRRRGEGGKRKCASASRQQSRRAGKDVAGNLPSW